MKTIRWTLCGAVAVLALGSMVARSPFTLHKSLVAQEQPNTAALARADEISGAFRAVAKRTLPAVVSIEAIGKVRQPSMAQLGDSLGGDPFADHPFLKDFFGRMPDRVPGQESGSPERRSVGQGSGFIIDPSGIIMTNAHVVQGADEVKVQLSDGRVLRATEVKVDDRADVAILRVSVNEQLPSLPLGDDEQMEIGDWVMAFGSPFGLHRTVTQGIISAKSRGLKGSRMRQEFIQTDAAINPGNSGGPLVNLRGEVIGINTAISTSSGGYDGVGFAVPVSLARWVGDQLTQNGKVRRAYLGVMPQEIDADLADALKMTSPHGVLIAEITKDSPADKAGLQIEDVVIRLNGQEITSSRKLIAVAERLTIGESYPIVILRDGQEKELKLTVGEFPEKLLAEKSDAEAEGQSSGAAASSGLLIEELGVEVEPMTPEIAEQLNLPQPTGVIVTSVRRGGLGQTLGISAGTAILKIGSTKISSVDDVKVAVAEAKKQGQVLMFLKTANGNQFISVPFRSAE